MEFTYTDAAIILLAGYFIEALLEQAKQEYKEMKSHIIQYCLLQQHCAMYGLKLLPEESIEQLKNRIMNKIRRPASFRGVQFYVLDEHSEFNPQNMGKPSKPNLTVIKGGKDNVQP